MPNTQEIGWNAVSKTGAVAAGGAGAVAAGIEILEAGGNAADAAAGDDPRTQCYRSRCLFYRW